MNDVSSISSSASDPVSIAQRVDVVESAVRMFRVHAFHEASWDLLALTAGLTVAELQHQFPTWDGLLLATIDRWNGQRMHAILPLMQSHGTVRFLRGIVEANVEDPALMRLLTAVLNIAATPDHPMAPLLQQRWAAFHHTVQDGLTGDVAAGREPTTMEPARGAEQLIALYEGLQLQFMVRPRMDLLEAFDRAITRLREGWSRAYIPPVWEVDLAH